MERKRITCPKSGHLEEIDLERTPFGIVIGGCSQFVPRCAIECERECARRMDRRDALQAGDQNERVLVVIPARDAAAAAIAGALAHLLAADRFTVEWATPDLRTAPPPPDYDVVIVGSSVRHGGLDDGVLAYVAAFRDVLAEMPTFLFFSGDRLAPASIPWSPTATAAFEHAGPAEYARIQAFAELIADEVPAIGSAPAGEFAKTARAVGA